MTSKASKTSKTETPEIDVPSAISVADLSVLLDVSPVEIVKALMRGGYMSVSYTHLTLPTKA